MTPGQKDLEDEIAAITNERNKSLTQYMHQKSIQVIYISGKLLTDLDTHKAVRNATLTLAHAKALHHRQQELNALHAALERLKDQNDS